MKRDEDVAGSAHHKRGFLYPYCHEGKMPARANAMPSLFVGVRISWLAVGTQERPAVPGQPAYVRRAVEVQGDAIRRSANTDVSKRELGPPEVVRGCR